MNPTLVLVLAVIILGALYGVIHVMNLKEQKRIQTIKVSQKENDYANYLNKADYLLKVAFGAVTDTATDRGITKSDAKSAAIQEVNSIFKDTPLDNKFSNQQIANAVEVSYQKYKQAGYDQHVMDNPLPDETVKQTLSEDSEQPNSNASVSSGSSNFDYQDSNFQNALKGFIDDYAKNNQGSDHND